jgi:ParB-like chromosome segregation protein Spo0J
VIVHKIDVALSDIDTNPNNPRKDMGDVKALAATFEANIERPGEPFAPPLLAANGKRYLVIDGERRVRAMRHAGTTKCSALVADNMDDANALLATIATDDKQALTAQEMSRGVQQMLLLGVEPDLAAKATRSDVLKMHSVKAAVAKMRPKKAATLSLDQLARAHDYPILAKGLADAIAEGGIERDDTADGYPKYSYVNSGLKSAEELKAAISKLSKAKKGRCVCRLHPGDPESSWSRPPTVTIYERMKADERGKPVKSEAEVRLARLTNLNKKDRKARAQWVADRIRSWEKSLKHTGAFVLDNLTYNCHRDLDVFEKKTGCKVPRTINAVLIANCWGSDYWDKLTCHTALGLSSVGYYSGEESYRHHLAMMGALIADGYEASESEKEIVALLETYLAKPGGKEDAS